MAESSQIFNL